VAQITEKIERLVQPLLDDLGFELVDLEYKSEGRGWMLRFYLDKEGGITLDDCAQASREISSLLDVEDVIDTAYNLEVSSPGIERPLKKLAHFGRFTGELAKIKTLDAIDPAQTGRNKKTFIGTLNGVDGQSVKMILQGKVASEISIDLDQIEKAHLVFDFN
jgi:ribosome maturation factor RimP